MSNFYLCGHVVGTKKDGTVFHRVSLLVDFPQFSNHKLDGLRSVDIFLGPEELSSWAGLFQYLKDAPVLCEADAIVKRNGANFSEIIIVVNPRLV